VKDAFGQESSCTANVTVIDSTPPIIACPNDQTLDFADASGAIATFQVTILSDNCPGVTAVCIPSSGSIFPIGTNNVTCVATDLSGNKASCRFSIIVLGPFGVKKSVLDQLSALLGSAGDKGVRKELTEAITEISETLIPSLWVDQTHLQPKKGEAVFKEDKEVVKELSELANDKHNGIPNLRLQIAKLAKADRLLATIAISDAVNKGGKVKEINDANKALAKSDNSIVREKYEDAFEHLGGAWKEAIEAVK
jgi:hypothetical protein